MNLADAAWWPRFEAKFEQGVGCWLWQGGLWGGGYGRFVIDGRDRPAHRVAYEAFVGPIPEGLDIDHLCRNRACVNPDHLEPVTRRENLLRGDTLPAAEITRTHCPRGHEYTEENTYYQQRNQSRMRSCKQCRRAAYRAWWARRKEVVPT